MATNGEFENVYKELKNNANMLNIKYRDTSKKSSSFVFETDNICNELISTFKINNEKFNLFFNQACSGSGHEKRNLSILRSSALCALLFFHNVNKVHIEIPVDNKKVSFDKVFFEIKNAVIKEPSNIDIVLVSSKNHIILFLESKFTEYYLDKKDDYDIKKAYLYHEIGKDFYNSDALAKLGLSSDFTILKKIKKNEKEEEFFKVISENNKSYIEGIKQMISHYIGLSNFVRRKNIYGRDSRNIELKKLFASGYSVYLGEILFDGFENDDIIKSREDYEEKYKKLAKLLNQHSNNTSKTKIKCLSEVLKYSCLKDFVNTTIKKFYFGE